MKKKSPIYPKYEMGAYGSDRFDPHLDFSQFLAEARHHARGVDFQSSSLRPEENGKKRSPEEKKCKKSWKNSLFSWWKTNNKKSKPAQVETATRTSSYNSIPRRRLASGPVTPVYGSGKTNDGNGRHSRSTSGPLTGLFNPTKTSENEIPYTCLDRLDRPPAVQTYGPLYLVT